MKEHQIAVFPAETEAGLEDKVRSTASVVTASRAVPDPTAALPEQVLAHLRSTAGNLSLPDLYPLKSVLVSTGLNGNDDFFERDETYAARQTPADKPFNYEHEAADIIGHMTASKVIGVDGSEVAEGSTPPEAFHILDQAVLYRHWPGYPDRQERMDRIIAEIETPPETGGWFVSMECRFKGFDYVLVPVENKSLAFAKAKIVSRGPDTAFLTKHLRAYGGNGTYKGYRVGRVLRSITFSGVGLVRNPANPDSVILTPESGAIAEKISQVPKDLGYELDSGKTIACTNKESNDPMNEQDKLQAALNDALAKLKTTEDKLAEATKTNWEKQVADLTAAKAAVDAQLVAKTSELAQAQKSLAEVEAAKAEALAQVEAFKTEAAKAAEAAKTADRMAKVKTAYAFEKDEDARATTESLKALPDADFEKHIATIAGYKTKSTPAKPGETKVTDKPAPMGGGSKLVTAGVLENTVPVATDPALATTTDSADAEAQALASEMETFFGLTEDEASNEEKKDAPKGRKRRK